MYNDNDFRICLAASEYLSGKTISNKDSIENILKVRPEDISTYYYYAIVYDGLIEEELKSGNMSTEKLSEYKKYGVQAIQKLLSVHPEAAEMIERTSSARSKFFKHLQKEPDFNRLPEL